MTRFMKQASPDGERSEVLNGRRPRADSKLINDLLETRHQRVAADPPVVVVGPPSPNTAVEPAANVLAGAPPSSTGGGRSPHTLMKLDMNNAIGQPSKR